MVCAGSDDGEGVGDHGQGDDDDGQDSRTNCVRVKSDDRQVMVCEQMYDVNCDEYHGDDDHDDVQLNDVDDCDTKVELVRN